MVWAVGEQNIVFYSNDNLIAGRNTIWVQTTLKAVVRIFDRLGLHKNLYKTKVIICNLGFISSKQGVALYKLKATGEGGTFREQKKTRVSCEECGTAIKALLLRHCMDIFYGIVISYTQGLDIGGVVPETYVVSFPRVLKLVEFLVNGFPTRAHSPGRLREHYMHRPWKANSL